MESTCYNDNVERQDINDLLKDFFARRAEVAFAYLFGSRATGRENILSDIDLAFYVDLESFLPRLDRFRYEGGLRADLVQSLRTNRVDLILLNEAPITLAHKVLQTGRLIYCRDPAARLRFHVHVSSRYPDVRRLLDVHYRRAIERIDRGTFGTLSHG